jgi:hypothetical protein
MLYTIIVILIILWLLWTAEFVAKQVTIAFDELEWSLISADLKGDKQ